MFKTKDDRYVLLIGTLFLSVLVLTYLSSLLPVLPWAVEASDMASTTVFKLLFVGCLVFIVAVPLRRSVNRALQGDKGPVAAQLWTNARFLTLFAAVLGAAFLIADILQAFLFHGQIVPAVLSNADTLVLLIALWLFRKIAAVDHGVTTVALKSQEQGQTETIEGGEKTTQSHGAGQ